MDSKNVKLEVANNAIVKKIRNNLLQAELELEEQATFEDLAIRVGTMAIEKLGNFLQAQWSGVWASAKLPIRLIRSSLRTHVSFLMDVVELRIGTR